MKYEWYLVTHTHTQTTARRGPKINLPSCNRNPLTAGKKYNNSMSLSLFPSLLISQKAQHE